MMAGHAELIIVLLRSRSGRLRVRMSGPWRSCQQPAGFAYDDVIESVLNLARRSPLTPPAQDALWPDLHLAGRPPISSPGGRFHT